MTIEITRDKRWIIPPHITGEADSALEKFPPILRQILFNRGFANYDEAKNFLNGKPNIDTNPFQMTGMQTA
ncbi:MAG TPA: hypothetical protein PLX90_10560, partial [Anaerolineales bacterium]|nr:hypothetical protein [Anaerolineales bacterium]